MGGFLFSVALSVCSQNPWNWNDRKGKDYLTISLWVSQNRSVTSFDSFWGLHEPVTPRTAFLDHVFFLFLLVPTMGSRTLSSRAYDFGSPGRFRGRPHPVLLHQNAEAGRDFWRQEFVVFNPKRGKKQCNKSPHFFFADRFGLISLFFVGDWIFVDLSICQSHMFHIKILIFNVTVMTLYQKH